MSKNDLDDDDVFVYVLFSVRKRSFYHSIWDIMLNAIVVISTIMLIAGNRRKRPSLYMPFIIIGVFELGFQCAKLILFIVASIAVLSDHIIEVPPERRMLTFFGIMVLSVIAVFIFLFDLYFVFVVNRGRRYLLDTQSNQALVHYTTRSNSIHPQTPVSVHNLTKEY
ncbi:hypothetical protein M3Y94_00872300 [Aphelenchoides besseyi]|nr:hypothetical protein M3Y94_00872300 [Aphelenchoides besseyi]